MQPEQQQRILGYFIEEAKDHLTTIEQGLLNLQNTLQDPEMVNEIFRAAHSIKGGAAMLGLNSIQRTSHRLEDFFKLLKECQSIQVNREIESLFLRLFDNLQALLDALQSESGLTEDVADRLMSEVEPVFTSLEQHLELGAHQVGGGEADKKKDLPKSPPPQSPSLSSVFQNSVPEILHQMLQLFKQPETPQTRQQLEENCNQLAQLGEQFNLSGWSTLCETAAGAVASSENPYRTLAPIVIKEIKQAQELVLANRANEIATCEQLQALSIKTFLFDWEETSATFESQDRQLTQMMFAAEQQPSEHLNIGDNAAQSELLTNIDELSTEEQITDWVAEDNLSSLFALKPLETNQNWQESSAISDFLNLENDLESSLNHDSGDDLSLISSEETSALNSLFGEAQDTLLDLTTTEPGFCDLFKAPQADLESLDLLESSTADSTGNPDLSGLWTEETSTPTQSELEEEFSFSLDANDLFASSAESFTLPVDLEDNNNEVFGNIDTATSNSSQLEQFDDFGLTEPEVDLQAVLECNLSEDSVNFDTAIDVTPTDVRANDTNLESSLVPVVEDLFSSVTSESELSLDLFEEAAVVSAVEIDFTLDASGSDLFNQETTPNLELFEAPTENSATDSTDELIAGFDPSGSDLFNQETTPNLELFEVPTEDSATDSTDELSAGFDTSASQSDFTLEVEAEDLFSYQATESSLELFEAPTEDSATDSTDELSAGFDTSASQSDFTLEAAEDLFTPEATESSLELFEAPTQDSAADSADELIAGFDTSASDLFNQETTPNLELFETPTTDSTDELIAGFDTNATEIDFTLEAAEDLFTPEATESSLELFEAPTQDSAADSADELIAGFDTNATEIDFTLEAAEDLFTPEATESSLELFEAPTQDSAADSADELIAGFDTSATEIDFTLEAAEDLFTPEATESSLELFEAPTQDSAADSADELIAGFDTSASDLFNQETTPNLELFETPTTDSADELIAGFDTSATEIDFTLEAAEDLFSPEATESSLELFEAPTQDSAADSADELIAGFDTSASDLFNQETTPNLELFETPTTDSADELIAGFDTNATEIDFTLEAAEDLFTPEATESSLELFEAPTQDSAADSADELIAGFDTNATEIDFTLEAAEDLFSYQATESSLELFEAPTQDSAADSADELLGGFDTSASQSDFTLEAEAEDLFTHQTTDSSLELFETAAESSVADSTDELSAEFDLLALAEMVLEDELNPVDFDVEEKPSQAESIEEDLLADVVSNVVAPEKLPNATTLGIEDDFADLEALLGEETTSNVLPTSGTSIDLEAPTVAPVTMATATGSSKDEFGDLDKLLEETPTTPVSATPIQPAQKQTASNSRRSTFEQMMRVPVKQLDSISNQVGELVVYRNSLEQDQERLRQFLDNLLHQVQQLGDVGTRMQELYERSLVEASLLSNRQGSQSILIDSSASKAHITGINFDALEMDRFTGFHTLAQEMIELIVRVREASSDIEFVTGETEQVARQFRQVTTQLQEGITRSRMVPFSQIADRLPRAVRDISLKYGKQAELQIEGKDTLIDKVILEQLYDPMTHLVNNAITHGIESLLERCQNGKSPVGQITIRAFHQGNQTVITVSDDGTGIDPERVKAKAIQNGIITPEAANNMSRLDVYNLLFHAGFSTKDKVDEFAGRGVGMDVVLTSLSQMRGTITTDSTLGKGTTFTIRLPLTLSICKALCCLSDKARIAFPMDGVEQMIDIPQEEVITNAEGQSCIPWRDSLLPFRHLKEFLTFHRQISRGNIYGSSRDDNMISVIVLRSADMFFAIQVDQVLGEQEIVIKQFEGPAPKPVGIAGATILGDGRVMPIADVLELIDISMGRIRHNVEATWWGTNNASLPPENQPAVKTEPMVLIVDDSITVRELLSMTFINAGYRVEQARDGQEAWDKLRDGLPCDLIFCDIEMPKMDGLELLSRLQQDPSLDEIPIAMLTSRGSDRHRQMALQLGACGYFTKPYLEEALLDGAQRMLKGEALLTPSSSNVNV